MFLPVTVTGLLGSRCGVAYALHRTGTQRKRLAIVLVMNRSVRGGRVVTQQAYWLQSRMEVSGAAGHLNVRDMVLSYFKHIVSYSLVQ